MAARLRDRFKVDPWEELLERLKKDLKPFFQAEPNVSRFLDASKDKPFCELTWESLVKLKSGRDVHDKLMSMLDSTRIDYNLYDVFILCDDLGFSFYDREVLRATQKMQPYRFACNYLGRELKMREVRIKDVLSALSRDRLDIISQLIPILNELDTELLEQTNAAPASPVSNKKASNARFAAVILLTNCEEDESVADELARTLRNHNPPLGVAQLSKLRYELEINPLIKINHWYKQADVIVPIVSSNYINKLERRKSCDFDPNYCWDIYIKMLNEYSNHGGNYRIRPVFLPQVKFSTIKYPMFGTTYRSTEDFPTIAEVFLQVKRRNVNRKERSREKKRA